MVGQLPRSLCVRETEYSIRTDFRDILVILVALNDMELSMNEKSHVLMTILYPNYANMPDELISEAYEKAVWFIDGGKTYGRDDQRGPQVMDWEKDEQILFPAINKVAGREVRSESYIHWWTFLGYYMEVGEGVFSTVVGIRQKRATRKKLEKWENEFYQKNKAMIDIDPTHTPEEQREIERLNEIFD